SDILALWPICRSARSRYTEPMSTPAPKCSSCRESVPSGSGTCPNCGAEFIGPAAPNASEQPSRSDVVGAEGQTAGEQATLVALLPSGETVTVSVRSKRCRIGRAAKNDLVLPLRDVSRAHAAVEAHDGGYRVVDLVSGTGVFGGDARVRGAATLKHGDLIR